MRSRWGTKYPRTFNVSDFEKKKITKGGDKCCPVCKAPQDFIIHHGFRKCRKGYTQRYLCLWCSKAWSENNAMHRMRNKREVIEKALELRQQGYSMRDIKKKLNNVVSSITIMRWIKKWNKKNKNNKDKSMK